MKFIGFSSRRRDVTIFTLGFLVGALGMVLQAAEGWGLVTLFYIAPGWLLGRHVVALSFRRRIKRVAIQRGIAWSPPEIDDGKLVWSFPAGTDADGDPLVCIFALEPMSIDDDEAERWARRFSGEDRT